MRANTLQLLVAAALTMLLAGCAAAPPRPLLLHPQFEQFDVHQIQLAPITFQDRAISRQLEMQVEEEILWQVEKVLQDKGYTVTRGLTEGVTVLRIRIDHLLDAGLYGRDQLPLRIYATASLLVNGTEIWRGEGTGEGEASPAARYTRHLEPYVASMRLAQSLLATLPDARR